MKSYRSIFLILTCLVFLAGIAAAIEPEVKWSWQGQSNLYGPPLVDDMHPAQGLETVVCDAEVRRIVCVDARGEELWRFESGFKKRLIASPALSAADKSGQRLLFVGNGDGNWACIDAATGQEVWRKALGAVEWANGLWADIDGDGIQEAVAPTEHKGVIVLKRDGTEVWRYQHPEGQPPLHIRGPMAAADIDKDGKCELFGAGEYGPFCLNSDGTLRWETITYDNYEAGVIIGLTGSGGIKLFTASHDDDAIWCFAADSGKAVWRQPLMGTIGIYAGSSIAYGDLSASPFRQIGPAERDSVDPVHVVIGDNAGYAHAFSAVKSAQTWSGKVGGPGHAAVSMGDVDGDGWSEVLVASGDHYLYCLDRFGNKKWEFKTGLRLMYPPTISDVDGDGKTDMLLCGSDSTLRCLTLNGSYHPQLQPWPMRGHDSAATNAYVRRKSIPTITKHQELLSNGGFEEGKVAEGLVVPKKDDAVYQKRVKQPKGWYTKTNLRDVRGELVGDGVPLEGCSRDSAEVFKGKYSLRVDDAITVASTPVLVPEGVKFVSASVYAKGTGSRKAMLRGTVLEASGTEGEWTRYQLDNLPVRNVRRVRLELESGEGGVYWDEASLKVEVQSPIKTEVLVNQVGYEMNAPKRFVVQSDLDMQSGKFMVLRGNEVVYTGKLAPRGRIQGAHGKDWGKHYYTGDFSALNDAGDYLIEVQLQNDPAYMARSYSFRIGENILFDETAEAAYKFFYYQRCGEAVPGIHDEPCHMDDAVGEDGVQYEIWGGWHDAGDYNTYHNAPYVHGLSRAYQRMKPAFDAIDRDGNGQSDFLDEILYGGEHSRRMIAPNGSAYGGISSGYGFWAGPDLETDGIPNTGDERAIHGTPTGHNPHHHQASMAKLAMWQDDTEAWVEPAARSLAYSLEKNQRGVAQFSTALDLFQATGDEKYATLAKELLPGISANATLVDAVRTYDKLFGEDHSAALREALVKHAEHLVALSENNPFGVLTFGSVEKPNFFKTPADQGGWHVGTTMYLLEAAELAALAYAYEPDPRYLNFVYNQFNWTLGMNPYNLSMMEGHGDAFLPSYHSRFTFGGVERGAIPGGVANGITWRAVGDDRPHVDLSGKDIPDYEPNEFWLPHNTNYLKALTALEMGKK